MKSKLVVVRRDSLIYTIEYVNSEPVRIIPARSNDANIGSIYVGRVSNVKKELGAAFVDFMPGVTGFLSFDNVTGNIKQGDLVTVRVIAEPVKTKGYSLSMRLEIPGEYVVVSDDRGSLGASKKLDRVISDELKTLIKDSLDYSVIIRTNAGAAESSSVLEEYKRLNGIMDDIVKFGNTRTLYSCLYEETPAWANAIRDLKLDSIEEIVAADEDIYRVLMECFPDKTMLYNNDNISINALYRVGRAIGLCTDKKVNLPSGGFLVIEPTEALTVIDVNSGKFDLKKNRSEMIMKVNKEAAEECARQLILRNISGMILIDFINPENEEQENVLLNLMKNLVKGDNVKCKVHGFTNLKLMEITRQKTRASIYDYL